MGEQKKYWEGKHFAFYTNKECEYYPCHPVPEGTEFNCLFCYCPLYMLPSSRNPSPRRRRGAWDSR